jgi:hypothetical protein
MEETPPGCSGGKNSACKMFMGTLLFGADLLGLWKI